MIVAWDLVSPTRNLLEWTEKREMAELTDLEGTVLGCVFRQGACTAHFVRSQFRVSPSPRFSDSTGSIYPLVRRLAKRGLLAKSTRREGQRDVEYYACTAAGRAALKRWVGPPWADADALTTDPLRTKLICLSALTARQRNAWVDQAEWILREKLSEIEAKIASSTQESGDMYLQLAHENAVGHLRANLNWLGLVRKRLLNEA